MTVFSYTGKEATGASSFKGNSKEKNCWSGLPRCGGIPPKI